MDYKINLYKGKEKKPFGNLSFIEVVRKTLSIMLNRDLKDSKLGIEVLKVLDDSCVGVPSVENLVPEYGYIYLKLYQNGVLTYRHPHPLSDIVGQLLQGDLRKKYPDEMYWAFRIDIPGIPLKSSVVVRPNVKNGIIVGQKDTKPRFEIKRILESDFIPKSLEDFGVKHESSENDSVVKVIMKKELKDELCEVRKLSNDYEEGGFVIGKVFKDLNNNDSYILKVTDVVQAEHTGASMLHFSFTGDSFASIKQTLRKSESEKRILGWYHTHLFSASERFNLSSIDLKLHFGTFTNPWQIAALINIDKNGKILRFYERSGNNMKKCMDWVV